MLEYPLGMAPIGASYNAYDEALHVAMNESVWDDCDEEADDDNA